MKPRKPHESYHIEERDIGLSQRKTDSLDLRCKYNLRKVRVALNQHSARPNKKSVACPFGSLATWDSSPESSSPPKLRSKRHGTAEPAHPADPAITTITTGRNVDASVERFRAFLISGDVLNKSDKNSATEMVANDPIVSYVVRIASMMKEGTVKGCRFQKIRMCVALNCCESSKVDSKHFQIVGFLQCRRRCRLAAEGRKAASMRDRGFFKASLGN